MYEHTLYGYYIAMRGVTDSARVRSQMVERPLMRDYWITGLVVTTLFVINRVPVHASKLQALRLFYR